MLVHLQKYHQSALGKGAIDGKKNCRLKVKASSCMLLRAWDWGGHQEFGSCFRKLGAADVEQWFRLAWSSPQYHTFILKRKHGDTIVFH